MQTKLLVAIVILLVVAVAVGGLALYRTYRAAPPTEAAAPASPAPGSHVVGPPAGEAGNQKEAPIDFDKFAAGGQYKAVCSEQADLLGDGNFEWIIGYQSAQTDDMGYPKDTAYFTLARYDAAKGDWVEWFSIPSPGNENALDDHSIRWIGDLRGDGKVEIGLVFYGYGVSSRPEPEYIYQITKDGAAVPFTDPFPIDKTSDDALTIDELLPEYPGQELALATAVMGGEAHSAPHRFKVTLFAWTNGLYRPVKSTTTSKSYPNAIAATEAVLQIDFD